MTGVEFIAKLRMEFDRNFVIKISKKKSCELE